MPQIVIPTPDTRELQKLVPSALIELAVLRTQAEHARAQELILDRKRTKALIVEKFAAPKKMSHGAWKSVCDLERELLVPLEADLLVLNRACDAYESEQRKLAEAEERRLEELARKEAEERRLAEAVAAEESGDTDGAEAILDEPVEAPVIRVEPTVAKVAGLSSRENWKGVCENFYELAKHIVAHPEDAGLGQVNQTALNQRAKSQKSLMRIPGCRAICETIRAGRVS